MKNITKFEMRERWPMNIQLSIAATLTSNTNNMFLLQWWMVFI